MAIDLAMTERVRGTHCRRRGLLVGAAGSVSCKHAKVARSEAVEAGSSQAATALTAPPGAASRFRCPGTEAGGRKKTYYVCDCGPDSPPGCRRGGDENEGESPDDPFRSNERARQQFAPLAPGAAI